MKMPRRHTNALAATRARFGLTQPQMAQHLGISTSMVKLVETNRRFLTTEKLVKLAALEIQLGAMPKETKPLPPCVQEVYDRECSNYAIDAKHHATGCTLGAKRLQKILRKMEFDYESAHTALHNLDMLEKENAGVDNPMRSSIAKMRTKQIKKLINCSPQKHAMLRKKIALLHAEAALYQSIHPRYDHTNEKPTPIISPLKEENMDYSVSVITSRADCQAKIDMANDDKEALAYRHTGLQRQKQADSITSAGIDADLAAVTAELAALQTVFASLPDGEVKDETAVKIKKADYKKFLLEERKGNYGSLSVIDKEYDIACIEQSMAETDALILALTSRMDELPQL